MTKMRNGESAGQIGISEKWAELAAQLVAETDPAKRAQLVDAMHAAYLATPSPLAGTTPFGLPYPSPTDPIAQGADAIRALAEALEVPRSLKRFYTPITYTLTTASVALPSLTMALDVKAGQKYNVIARIRAWNSSSGASRTATFRMIENGVNLTPTATYAMVFVAGSTALECIVEIPRVAAADGTMTYQVGGMASVNSTCTVTEGALEAISMPGSSSQELAVGEEGIAAIEDALRAERAASGVE
jgi:hypothetical protein